MDKELLWRLREIGRYEDAKELERQYRLEALENRADRLESRLSDMIEEHPHRKNFWWPVAVAAGVAALVVCFIKASGVGF